MSSEPLIIAADGCYGLFVVVSGEEEPQSFFFTSFFQLLNFFSSAPNLTLPLQEWVTLPKSLFVGWQTILTFHMPVSPLNAQMHFIFPQYREPLAKEVGT